MTSTMEICSSALRGVVIASPGKKLVVVDYANIEGRLAAWLTNETWKLQAFRDFDEGRGEDLYKIAYGKMFKVDPKNVTKAQRQIGKVEELSRAYQGGVGATVRMAAPLGIDLEALAESAIDTIPDETRDEATDFLIWQRKEKKTQHGLSDRAFIVCDSFKRLWRAANPNISKIWNRLEEAAINAIENPKKVFTVDRHRFIKSGSWLRISRPNGNCLCYPLVKLVDGKITYLGKNQFTQKWERVGTYGGKIFENLCQAVAGDLLKHAMVCADEYVDGTTSADSSYPTVLTVHDELVAEVPDTSEYSVQGLGQILINNPPWASGLPLAFDGFEAYRYGKPD